MSSALKGTHTLGTSVSVVRPATGCLENRSILDMGRCPISGYQRRDADWLGSFLSNGSLDGDTQMPNLGLGEDRQPMRISARERR